MSLFSAKIHDTLGPSDSPVRLLLINPNSTLHFTQETVSYLSTRLPSGVRIDFYTPPSDAPPSIDGTFDGVLSAAVILNDLGLDSRHTADSDDDAADNASFVSRTYSAVIVSCFSAHPLVPALQERLPFNPKKPPVIGILEAAVHYGLLLGPTFGIATTGRREWARSRLRPVPFDMPLV
jgi:allantoin racemase